MYASMILSLPGMALFLGSNASAILSLIPLSFLFARISLEERFLRTHLSGYADYTRRVPWRIVPRIW